MPLLGLVPPMFFLGIPGTSTIRVGTLAWGLGIVPSEVLVSGWALGLGSELELVRFCLRCFRPRARSPRPERVVLVSE